MQNGSSKVMAKRETNTTKNVTKQRYNFSYLCKKILQKHYKNIKSILQMQKIIEKRKLIDYNKNIL